MPTLNKVIDKLRTFPWSSHPIFYAVLFGSLVKRGVGNDVDIAVEFTKPSLESYGKLFMELEDNLGGQVDLVPISDDSSCYLVHEAFSDGIILYVRDDDAWWRMHRRAHVCEDFLIDASKLDIVNTAVRRVMEGWRL